MSKYKGTSLKYSPGVKGLKDTFILIFFPPSILPEDGLRLKVLSRTLVSIFQDKSLFSGFVIYKS